MDQEGYEPRGLFRVIFVNPENNTVYNYSFKDREDFFGNFGKGIVKGAYFLNRILSVDEAIHSPFSTNLWFHPRAVPESVINSWEWKSRNFSPIENLSPPRVISVEEAFRGTYLCRPKVIRVEEAFRDI